MTDYDTAVNEFTTKAKASVDVYAELAKRAGARLTSANPQPTQTWVEDIVTFWSTAGQDALNLLTLQQKLASAAAPKK